MGMKRVTLLQDVPTQTAQTADTVRTPVADAIESGAKAAIGRLSTSKFGKTDLPAFKARDYEAEAIGKTRCVQFEAALMSPAIAGMKFDTMEEYLKLVRQAAEAGVAFSFEK